MRVGTANIRVRESCWEFRGANSEASSVTHSKGCSERGCLPSASYLRFFFGLFIDCDLSLNPGECSSKLRAFLSQPSSDRRSGPTETRLAVPESGIKKTPATATRPMRVQCLGCLGTQESEGEGEGLPPPAPPHLPSSVLRTHPPRTTPFTEEQRQQIFREAADLRGRCCSLP